MLNLIKTEFIKQKNRAETLAIILSLLVCFSIPFLAWAISAEHVNVFVSLKQIYTWLLFAFIALSLLLWWVSNYIINIDNDKWWIMFSYGIRIKYFVSKMLFSWIILFLGFFVFYIALMVFLYEFHWIDFINNAKLIMLSTLIYLLFYYIILILLNVVMLAIASISHLLNWWFEFINFVIFVLVISNKNPNAIFFSNNLWYIDPFYYPYKFFLLILTTLESQNGKYDTLNSSNLLQVVKLFMGNGFIRFYELSIMGTFVVLALTMLYYRRREVK